MPTHNSSLTEEVYYLIAGQFIEDVVKGEQRLREIHEAPDGNITIHDPTITAGDEARATLRSLRETSKMFSNFHNINCTLFRTVHLRATTENLARLQDANFSSLTPFVKEIAFHPSQYELELTHKAFQKMVIQQGSHHSLRKGRHAAISASYNIYHDLAEAHYAVANDGSLQAAWTAVLNLMRGVDQIYVAPNTDLKYALGVLIQPLVRSVVDTPRMPTFYTCGDNLLHIVAQVLEMARLPIKTLNIAQGTYIRFESFQVRESWFELPSDCLESLSCSLVRSTNSNGTPIEIDSLIANHQRKLKTLCVKEQGNELLGHPLRLRSFPHAVEASFPCIQKIEFFGIRFMADDLCRLIRYCHSLQTLSLLCCEPVDARTGRPHWKIPGWHKIFKVLRKRSEKLVLNLKIPVPLFRDVYIELFDGVPSDDLRTVAGRKLSRYLMLYIKNQVARTKISRWFL